MKYDRAKKAIEDLISDRSISTEKLIEYLEELSCLCDGQIEAMREEMRNKD